MSKETIACDLCGQQTGDPHTVDVSKPDSEIIATLDFCPSCLASIWRSIIPKLSPSDRLAKLSKYVSALKYVPSKAKVIDKKVEKLRNDVLEALARLEQLEW